MNLPGRHKAGPLSPTVPLRVSPQAHAPGDAVGVALNAVILAVRAGEPVVAIAPAQHSGAEALPCGPFRPVEHAALENALRAWVHAQTGVEMGFLQQLCTLSGHAAGTPGAPPVIAVSYLALVGPRQCSDRTRASWRSCYAFLPWEDWRHGRPECLADISPRLEAWAAQSEEPPCAAQWPPDRRQRIRLAFGNGAVGWDEEKALERYELLREAGIVGPEAEDSGRASAAGRRVPRLAHPMLSDQAQVLARALGELRRALKYRPVVFELMPDEFTLFELQKTVEAILGPNLHKQNFRRLVEGCRLVEPTGEFRLRTGGRPARLYRFRRDVIYEQSAPGVRVKPGRA
jgi:hypothetical protein